MLPDWPDPWCAGLHADESETETDIDRREPVQTGPPPTPGDGAQREDWTSIAQALRSIGHLKRVPRTGWLDRGVPEAATESVADHAFRVALLAWMVATVSAPDEGDRPAIDPARVLLIALAHDLPEAVAGDPTPYDPGDIPPSSDVAARREFLQRRQERDPARAAAKRAAEQVAMAGLLAGLPVAITDRLGGAWREYEEQATPEARLVKQADRLETYLQSREYLAGDPALPMASFALQIADPATLPDAAMRSLRDAIDRVMADGGDDDRPPDGAASR